MIELIELITRGSTPRSAVVAAEVREPQLLETVDGVAQRVQCVAVQREDAPQLRVEVAGRVRISGRHKQLHDVYTTAARRGM